MTNPKHAIEEVPKDFINEYKVEPNKAYYTRVLKSSVSGPLDNLSRQIKADFGDGFSEAYLLSISFFRLYVNNYVKIQKVIPFIGGLGIKDQGQVGNDLSNKKGKRKQKPIQQKELTFSK